MPVVVQPAIAIAKSDAAAALIDTELMVSLLSSQQRMTAIAAPRVKQTSSVSASVSPTKFMGSLAFFALFSHRRRAGARLCRCACNFYDSRRGAPLGRVSDRPKER
jgi:hypothetical protein